MEPQAIAIAGRYACEPPERLWRVQYEGNNLQSRGKAEFTSGKTFRRAVESHLEWRNPAPSPFISTFDNQRHAVNWASKLMDNRNYDSVLLHEIDTTKLGPVFCVENLVSRLRVQTKLEPSVYEDEYLVLGRIPKQSICSTRSYNNNVRLEDHGYTEEEDPDWYFDDEAFDPDAFDEDEYYDYDEVDLDLDLDRYGEASETEDDPYEEYYDYKAWPEDLDPDSCDEYEDYEDYDDYDEEENPEYWPEEVDPDCWPEEVDPDYYSEEEDGEEWPHFDPDVLDGESLILDDTEDQDLDPELDDFDHEPVDPEAFDPEEDPTA